MCAVAYTSRHLASPDFLQKVVILYISTQDQDTVLCHKISMYLPLHTSQAFLSLCFFLPSVLVFYFGSNYVHPHVTSFFARLGRSYDIFIYYIIDLCIYICIYAATLHVRPSCD